MPVRGQRAVAAAHVQRGSPLGSKPFCARLPVSFSACQSAPRWPTGFLDGGGAAGADVGLRFGMPAAAPPCLCCVLCEPVLCVWCGAKKAGLARGEYKQRPHNTRSQRRPALTLMERALTLTTVVGRVPLLFCCNVNRINTVELLTLRCSSARGRQHHRCRCSESVVHRISVPVPVQ